MLRYLAVLAAISLTITACGSNDGGVSDAERQRLIDDLIDNAGVDPDAATCAVDGQIDAFGARIIDPNDAPTDAEVGQLVEIWQGCGLIPSEPSSDGSTTITG